MTDKLYYLFGSDAVDSYMDDEPIDCDFGLFCYDPSKDHPSSLLEAYDGWGDYAQISEELYNELNKKGGNQ